MSTASSFELEIRPYERSFENRKWNCDEADVHVLSEAAELLAERTYQSDDGLVRIRFDWIPLIERCRLAAELNARIDPDAGVPPEELPPAGVIVGFVDERERPDERDVLSFVELFLHESFLMLNVAVPGSFGGRMRGLQGRELFLDARVFEIAWATAAACDWPNVEPLPLSDVKAWYDALGIGTQQVATTSTARALFHLLHLSRGEEDDTLSVIRLALAVGAIFDARESFLAERIESILGRTDSLDAELRRLLADRDALLLGTAPVAHPMYDDMLDPRADDPSFDYTEVVDFASRVIVGALQDQVRQKR